MDSPQPTTTSFIPKTRLTGPVYRRKGIGFGVFIAVLVLLVSLGLFAGVYFYKKSLTKEIEEASASLERAKKAFEPGLISELTQLDSDLKAAEIILLSHSASSKIFDLIGDLTLPEVAFSSFSFNLAEKKPIITMAGEAKSYTTVALQARIFEESEFIDKASFSGLSLKEAGKVGFSAELIINPSYLIYKP